MTASVCISTTLVLVLSSTLGIGAQTIAKGHTSPAQLELTMEVATTNDERLPQALRITARNIGGVAVTMPVLGDRCAPENGLKIQTTLSARDGKSVGVGGAGACGIFDRPSLSSRIRTEWVLLRPNEYMTATLRLTPPSKEPGTVEYWAEYWPPNLTKQESEELVEAGYVIPTEKMETEHASFEIH